MVEVIPFETSKIKRSSSLSNPNHPDLTDIIQPHPNLSGTIVHMQTGKGLHHYTFSRKGSYPSTLMAGNLHRFLSNISKRG